MSEISVIVPKEERDRLKFIRWVLFLVNAAEASGIGPLPRREFHSLLFLSFATARFYGIAPLRVRAQRTDQGPYYRVAHIALGMLTLGGLVDLEDFKPHLSPKQVQFEGTFSVTPAGLAVGRTLRETHQGESLYQFLLDLCLGTVSGVLDEEEKLPQTKRIPRLDEVFEADLTYRQAVNRRGKSLVVEESPDDRGPTIAGLKSIDDFLKKRTAINRKDVLSAYQTLLMRRAA